MIDGNTCFVGIIGQPLTHTLSPFIHNTAFELLGLNWVYLPFPIEDASYVKDALQGLKVLGCKGINVTAPYKEVVIPFIDELSERAKMLGAVNTIIFHRENNKVILKGENTDLQGFRNSVVEGGFDLSTAQFPVVIGAGGAARSVLGALYEAGCKKVLVVNRSQTRAEGLVNYFRGYFNDITYMSLDEFIDGNHINHTDILVHTTPIGTMPNVDHTVFNQVVDMPSHLVVVDLVYNPLETKLIKQARKAGAQTIGGLGMLLHQAAIAFELWTGEKMPLSQIKEKLMALSIFRGE